MGTRSEPAESEVDAALRELARAPVLPVPAAASFTSGAVVDERLRIARRIGSGGMGVVFSARHLLLGRDVAVKFTRSSTASAASERLLREARAMAKIVHEHVVTVYDVGTYRDHVYIAMEYLDGGTARSWVEAERRPWRDVVTLYLAAGRGLAAAHAAGLVHRDFKPDNVLLGSDGRVRVADFGLVRAVSREEVTDGLDESPPDEPSDDHDPPLTQTGAQLGTRAYMAPELHRGQTANESSDQFSFCVSLWEALFGSRPDSGAERTTVTSGHKVPRPLVAALRRGLSQEPAERFATMDALLAAISKELDRKSLARRIAAPALLAGLAVAWVVLRDEPPDPCDPIAARMESVWNPARAEAIAETQGASFGEAGATLDEYASQWAQAARSACEATHVEHAQTPEVLALRLRCLDSRKAEVAALVEMLSEPDAIRPSAIDDAVAALSTPDACEDGEALARVEPIEPDDLEAVQALEADLARVKGLVDAGRYVDAVNRAEELEPKITELGYRRLQARLWSSRALAEVRLSRSDDAATHYRKALGLAVEARDDRLVHAVLLDLGYSDGYERGEHDAGRDWLQQAESWAKRFGSTNEDEIARLASLSLIDREEGKLADAVQRIERALELLEERGGRAELRLYAYLAEHHRVAGDPDAARAAIGRALPLAEAIYGPEHPEYGRHLINAGGIEQGAGDLEAAREFLVRGGRLRHESMGPGDRMFLNAEMNIATIDTQLGHAEIAAPRMRAAIEQAEAAGLSEGRIAQMKGIAAVPLIDLGRLDEAMKVLEEVVEIEGRLYGPAHDTRLIAMFNLANLHQRVEAFEESLVVVDDALGVVTEQSNSQIRAGFHMLAGVAHRKLGHPQQSLDHYEACLRLGLAAEGPDRIGLVNAAVGATRALIELGRIDEARTKLEQARSIPGANEITLAEIEELAQRLDPP